MKLNNLNNLILLTIISITFMTSSCATKMQTRAITSLSESDRTEIKRVAIFVQSDEQLNVNLAKVNDRYWTAMLEGAGGCNSIGCIFLPVVIAAAAVIEESVRSGMDHSKEKEFREDLSDINLNNLLSESIDKSFESLNAGFKAEISETHDPKVLSEKGYDSILDITLKKIEVNKCPKQVVYGYIDENKARQGLGPYSTEDDETTEVIRKWNSLYPEYSNIKAKIQIRDMNKYPLYAFGVDTMKKSKEDIEKSDKKLARLNSLDKEIADLKFLVEEYASSDQIRLWTAFHGKITSIKGKNVLWERQEVYYDPKCERVKDMQADPKIIVGMVSRSLSNMASNTVDHILY